MEFGPANVLFARLFVCPFARPDSHEAAGPFEFGASRPQSICSYQTGHKPPAAPSHLSTYGQLLPASEQTKNLFLAQEVANDDLETWSNV